MSEKDPPAWLKAWELHPHCPKCYSNNLKNLPEDTTRKLRVSYYECLDCQEIISYMHGVGVTSHAPVSKPRYL